MAPLALGLMGSARRWQKRFLEFSYDVRKLAMKYAEERRRTSG